MASLNKAVPKLSPFYPTENGERSLVLAVQLACLNCCSVFAEALASPPSAHSDVKRVKVHPHVLTLLGVGEAKLASSNTETMLTCVFLHPSAEGKDVCATSEVNVSGRRQKGKITMVTDAECSEFWIS